MKRFVVLFAITTLAIAKGNCQPVFYSQSLQKLYYSLPERCRAENPVADTVVLCTGILPDISVPVVFCRDGYGMLAHVGYRFLVDVDSLPFHPAVVRFLERELLSLLVTDNLEQKLNTNRENSLTLLHNGNTPQRSFYRNRNGLPFLLQHVSGMDIHYLEGKRYEVHLACGQGQNLTFQFLADAELLSDMDKKERDDRIAAQLSHHRAKANAPPHIPVCSDAIMQVHNDSAFVCMGRSFIIPQINSNMYYTKSDDTFKLAFGKNWIVETLSNAMLAPSERNYTVQITHRVYGGRTHLYEVDSRDFFDYFSNEYDRFFGIESVDRDILAGTLILSDKNAGNIHIAFVSISVLDLLNGGIMKIQLNTNIPQHNVETLFGRTRETSSDNQFIINIR